jgi:hypothetical protein
MQNIDQRQRINQGQFLLSMIPFYNVMMNAFIGYCKGETSTRQARGSSSGGEAACIDRGPGPDKRYVHPEADEREALHREVDGPRCGQLLFCAVFLQPSIHKPSLLLFSSMSTSVNS